MTFYESSSFGMIWLRLSGFYIIILVFFYIIKLICMEVQHGDMTVMSEERVLDVILTWCMGACETFHWTSVDELLRTSTPEQLFGERLSAINTLLPLVRFPLMQLSILKRVHTVFSILLSSNLCRIKFVWVTIFIVVSLQMERSNLANHIQAFRHLVSAFLLQSRIF